MFKNQSILFSLILIFSSKVAFGMEVSLPLPDYSEEAVIGSNVGIRPCRTGGTRLEKQTVEDKAIFHNYGHGGSGVTLAPGCTEHVVSLFNAEEHEPQHVSVIGAGYMGLLTAHQLADQGHKVTVCANQFPSRDYFYKEESPCITSLAAGGLWLPFDDDKGIDSELFNQIQTRSFEYYAGVASETSGVTMRDVYSFSYREGRVLPKELEAPTDVKVEFGNGQYTPAKKWSTLYVDGSLYLNGLYESAGRKSITFEERAFSDIDDVLGLKDTYIFNCSGYGSKVLFGDTALKSVRGQLLYLSPQPSIDFFLSARVETGMFTIFPSGDKIAVWGTYEPGVEELKTDPDELEKIRQRVASFFKDKI